MSAEMALKEALLNVEMFNATLAHAQEQKQFLEEKAGLLADPLLKKNDD